MDKRARYKKSIGRSSDQAVAPKSENLLKGSIMKKTSIKDEPSKKATVLFDVAEDPEEDENAIRISISRPPDDQKQDKTNTPEVLRKLTKGERQLKKDKMIAMKNFRKASVRWNPISNPFAFDGLDIGGAKMITNSKLNRLKSALPSNMLDQMDSDSDQSDPEIKRLKRKAGICCKFMTEWMLIFGIMLLTWVDFNFISLLYYLGALLLFSERMSLSIKEDNPRQQSLIVMFMLSIPVVIVYKTTAIVFIYANLSKFNAVKEMQEFFENDILFETFTNIAYYTGVVCAKEMSLLNFIQTIIPEALIGIFILCLNYVSSNKIDEEYMNTQDVLHEKSLALGSTSLSILFILSIEFLAIVNISWIGLIFQIFVLIGMSVAPFKKLFVIDLICLISIFLSAWQLILLFMRELPLIPMGNLWFVYHFIGVDEDKTKLAAVIHASGATTVFMFGIVYLRSRRLDELSTMFGQKNDYSGENDLNQSEDKRNIYKKQDTNPESMILDIVGNNSGDESSFDYENAEAQHIFWRVYDKIIDAITSQFIVLNIWRLGLCLWILRYNCLQSIPIIIFLFHSTLVKSLIGFLPLIKFIYLPYLFLNILFFYVVNTIYRIQGESDTESLKNVKYGIINFENPALEFPIMLFVIFLVLLLIIKIEHINNMLGEQDEISYELRNKQKTLKNIQRQSSVFTIIYYLFYLSIEAALLFILLINVVSKINMTNFWLNLYLVVYLIFPTFARRNIRVFLFLIELFNLINYVYGIIIASSEGIFYAGEVGNLIGIDSYQVYVRKYFNVIPTIRITGLIIITMTIWNTIPNEGTEEENDFSAKLYKTMYKYSKWFTEYVYSIINFWSKMIIWVCYALIIVILIINDHSMKNWIQAIMIMLIIYKHLSTSNYYMHYFATYAGFVFISTWMYQFFKFDFVRELFGVKKGDSLVSHGEFWGYTVLTEEQLLFRVIALTSLLVLSVIGMRSLNSRDYEALDHIEIDPDDVRSIHDDELYYKVLRLKEDMLWNKMTIFYPIFNFIATFFNIPVMIIITIEALYWRLSWVMVIYLFFSVGPWYNLNLDFLMTKNLGKEKPLNYYSNFAVQEQRNKKWKMLMWITMIAFIIIFPSNKFLEILNKGIESKLIFYGVWAGLLYPNSKLQDITFFEHVSGYLWILFFLVIEKKCLEWLNDEESRILQMDFEHTIGSKNTHRNYELLTKEIERRQKLEDKRAGRATSKKINFKGLDEEGKIDPKEKLKKELDDAYSLLSKASIKKEETKKPHPPALKSALKKPKAESHHTDGPDGPRPFDETTKSADDKGSETDDEFNILFTRDDPKRNETKKLLLFQYKIKFMRGAKVLVEELITFALLIWALYKDNILSLIYYWMCIRMLVENVNMKYRMSVAFYISLFSVIQYFLCLSNWNNNNSQLELPIPFNPDYEDSYISPPLPLPWVDGLDISNTWKMYLWIDKNSDILHSIMFEVIVLCLSSIYVYSFSPYLYNIDDKETRDYLKVRTELGKNLTFLDYVQSSSIFATVYKGIKAILFNTCHIFLILILLVLTSQNSGVLAIGYLLFALFYLYKSLDLLMDKYWDYPEAIHTFKYYIIWDWAVCIIYQLPFFYLHYKENYFNSLQAFIGLESFWLDYSASWNSRAIIWMLLKFLALWFIHLQEILFKTDDYHAYKQSISKKSITRKKALWMAYLLNNRKIHKQHDATITKKNMKLKLDLIQEQLSGSKFGQLILGTSNQNPQKSSRNISSKNLINPFLAEDSDDDGPPQPYMRKAISEYDPALFQKEERALEKKRLELEKSEKDIEFFQDFSEAERIELNKLDKLTRLYLFLRRNITNPIISCDEIDISYVIKDISAGSLHCQHRIERIAKKKFKTARERKVLKGLTETKTMIVNILSTLIYCLVSYTSVIAYLFMFLNCMWTGNLMSMFYPLSILLYALLEDPRPKSGYWNMIMIYAELVILFKFLIQQNALTVLTPGSLFVQIVDKYKLGFRVFDKKEYAHGIFSFIIWDILVALSVLLHQHCLVLIGLWKKRETDIETTEEAKRRIQIHRQKSKLEKQLEAMKKIEAANRKYNTNSDSDKNKLKPPIQFDNINLLKPQDAHQEDIHIELRPIDESNTESSEDDNMKPPTLSLRRPKVQIIESPKEEVKKMETMSDDKSSSSDDPNLKPPIMKKSSLKKTHSEEMTKDDIPKPELIKRRSRTKRENSLVLKPGDAEKFKSLKETSPEYSRKKSVINFDRKRLEEDTDEDEEININEIVYGDNYFIHDYSEESKSGTMESCEGRIQVKDTENYSNIEFEIQCNSENNIKYYEGLDDEAIITLQNDMIAAYNQEVQFFKDLEGPISFKEILLQNQFIKNIFPDTIEDKPGVDLYKITATIQFVIVSYILFFFSQMTGEKEELSETFKFKRFRTEMIFFMFIQIMLIILDRYFYISNTSEKEDEKENSVSSSSSSESSDENTDESVDLNKVKEKPFFKTFLKNGNKINFIKLIIYIFMVISVHSLVIWYFPISGNYKINEQIYCDENGPCNDLSDNIFLWGFYILYIIYFSVTALQFRYGLPEIRKGEFMYDRYDRLHSHALDAYYYIPFLFEVKTYIDWTFTKTSLRIWDWFMFETIYSEFYYAKVGEERTESHQMGDSQSFLTKVIYGCSGLIFCLGLILAPLIIFSSLNPIAELNLVKGAGIELNIELEEGRSLYNVFSTSVANEIRNLTEEEFSLLNFRKYKELRVSDHNLYQRVEMLPYSDKIWSLSPPAIRKMKDHFENAMKNNYSDAAISLEISFNRQYPPGSNIMQNFVKKKIMDIDNYAEIFNSFYEALSSTDWKPVFIKLDRFYPSVVHLTNVIAPEVVKIKYKTVNLKIFCTSDPLIGDTQVKYWTMYIDDDLNVARRKKKLLEDEDEKSLKIKEHKPIDEEYIYEHPETMGISDTSQDKSKIEGVEYGVYDESDSIINELNETDANDESKMIEINSEQNTQNTTITTNSTAIESNSNLFEISIITESDITSETNMTSDTSPSTNDSSSIRSPARMLGEADVPTNQTVSSNTTITSNNTADADINSMKFDLDNAYNEIIDNIENSLKIPQIPNYSQDTLAKLQDLEDSQGTNETMGVKSETKNEIIKDEHESANQMGVVIYTFSDKVTPGLLEYSVITFYISVVFVAGKLLRGYLWGQTEKIYLSELPYPDELLVIWEGVIISRMQGDIKREEELYLILIDLIRSPEVLKIITHPQIKPKED